MPTIKNARLTRVAITRASVICPLIYPENTLSASQRELSIPSEWTGINVLINSRP